MTVYNVIQNQAGIQYQGVQDKSEADPRDSLLNVIMAGEFLRGRTDKPFKVTAENIRSVLGYQPENPYYMAIEDMLADGAPYVWVQRIGSNASQYVAVNCEVLTSDQIWAACNYAINESYTPDVGIEVEAVGDINQNIITESSLRSALNLIKGARLYFLWLSDNGVDKTYIEVPIPNLVELMTTQDPVNYEWWMTKHIVDFASYPEIQAKLASLFTSTDLATISKMQLEIGFECNPQSMGGQSKLMITPWTSSKLVASPFKLINYSGIVYTGMSFCYAKSDRVIAVDWEQNKFSSVSELATRTPLRFGQNDSSYWATLFRAYNVVSA